MSEHRSVGDSDEAENLVVRPARPQDREPVLAFCAETWDGGDYIAEVWDRWLADTTGTFLVAVLDNQPVGIIHVAMLSAEDAWLEGIRVAPAVRRQGIARVLTSQGLVAARERGAKVARLITDQDNTASQGLVTKKFGFQRVAEMVRYEAAALDTNAAEESAPLLEEADTEATTDLAAAEQHTGSATELETEAEGPLLLLAGIEDYERIQDWFSHSNLAPFNGGLQFGWWRAWALTEADIHEYLRQGAVWLLEEWDSIQAMAIVQEQLAKGDLPATLQVLYLDGAASSIGVLALALREIAQDRDLADVELWLPELLILRDAMDGAGYTHEDNDVMWVYARTL